MAIGRSGAFNAEVRVGAEGCGRVMMAWGKWWWWFCRFTGWFLGGDGGLVVF